MHDKPPIPSGRLRPWIVLPAHWGYPGAWSPNSVIQSWGAIFGNLSQGRAEYRIARMYLEFRNVADVEVAIDPPGFNRGVSSGRAYYDGLADSADTDYLRVPLLAQTLNSSDPILFPDGNLVTFFAQTAGLAGVGGLPFSDANNSVVYGAALVATPDDGDPTQDLVFSRAYLDADQQRPKIAGSSVGIEWEVLFG